jgi:hypothetical protein
VTRGLRSRLLLLDFLAEDPGDITLGPCIPEQQHLLAARLLCACGHLAPLRLSHLSHHIVPLLRRTRRRHQTRLHRVCRALCPISPFLDRSRVESSKPPSHLPRAISNHTYSDTVMEAGRLT